MRVEGSKIAGSASLADAYTGDDVNKEAKNTTYSPTADSRTSALSPVEGGDDGGGGEEDREAGPSFVHGGSGSNGRMGSRRSSLGISLLRKSVLGSAPLPSVVYHPTHLPAKHDDLAVTGHLLGRVVRP